MGIITSINNSICVGKLSFSICVCVCVFACVLIGDFLEVEISGDTKNTTMEHDLGRKNI